MIPGASCMMSSVGAAAEVETFRTYMLSLGAKSYFDARTTPKNSTGDPCADGEAVETWDRVSATGEAVLDTVGAGTPNYDAADADGYPCLIFNNDQMIGQGTDDLVASVDYAIIGVFTNSANGGVFGWHNASGGTAAYAGLFRFGSSTLHRLNSDTPNLSDATDTPGVDALRHLVILERVGASIYLTCDGRTRVSNSTPAGTFTLDKMSVGAYNSSGSPQQKFTGNLYAVGRLERGLTSDERTHIYDLARLVDARGWGTV